MVLVYHLFPGSLPGGFLGVDLFFVISGFLITSLLFRELAATGRIRLTNFWQRRARRLLPPVVLVVVVSTGLAYFVDKDLLVGVGRQIAGAFLFVSNWVFVANGSDYFTRDTPELFRNFWSLALEEQFYLVLPLAALLLWKIRSRATRVLIFALLGASSAALMMVMSAAGTDATRIYFGSDSHSFGLLFGAALAALTAGTERVLRLRGQALTTAVALLSLAVLGTLAWLLPEGSDASFRGGFQLASLAGVALVWAVTRPGALSGRALDVQPLKWIGERSYGIYLWHWPLLLVVTAAFAGSGSASSWLVPVLTLALTFVLAELSYTYIEQPVRVLGLRAALKQWFSPRSHTRRKRTVALALTGVLAVAAPLTVLAVATAPAMTSSAESIQRGAQLLEADRAQASQAPENAAPDKATPVDPKSGAVPGDETAAPEQVPTNTVTGVDITAVGDSVMLASYPELSDAFPGIDVDAAVSRGMWAGVEILSNLKSQHALRSVIVVGLGTNGPVDQDSLEQLHVLAEGRPVVLVNAHGERDWIPGVNAELAAFADSHRGVTLAGWDEAIAGNYDYLAADGIHPGADGGRVYAATVVSAIDQLFTPAESLGWGLPRR